MAGAAEDNRSGAEGARSPLAELLVVAAPAVVTMTSYTLMQFVDTRIVAEIGPEAVAATGNGGIAAFVPAAAMFGMLGVINTYVSQHLGAGRPERGAAYAWNGLWMTLAVWAVVLLPYAVVLPGVLSGLRELFGVDPVAPAIREMESAYGRLLLVGMVFTIAARGIGHYFYGIHRANIVMISAVTANALNVPITYALVVGAWGFPEMGVAGAALGTIIGGAVETAIPLALFLSPKYARELGTRRAWRPDLERVKDIWRIGWPAGLMIGSEIVCWFVFMTVLIAGFGTAHNTAGMVALRYMHLSFMPAVGLSIAVTAVVGRQIGAGRKDLVPARTGLGLAVSLGYMGLCALCFVLFREPLVAFFVQGMNDGGDPEQVARIVEIGATVLIVAAAFQVFDAAAICLTGALRGAGDTVWPGVVTMALSWTCLLGLGTLFTHAMPGWGSIGPWVAAAIFITLLALAMAYRFYSGAWKRIEVIDRSGLAADAGEGVVPELPGIDAEVRGAAGAGVEATPAAPATGPVGAGPAAAGAEERRAT